ncbi:trypsin-like serine peptidase [Arthrobacter sp. 2MCAF14]|uniref:trypsin-like serine peptidase n=1 Tax=Arthrobacter sp. 2MCAF14 TaxID=3232982 RepID=UPI003F8FD8CC
MTRTKTLATSMLSLTAAALLALGAGSGATAAPSINNGPDASTASSNSASDGNTADYWTPERMKNAVSGDVLASKALTRAQAAVGLSGLPVSPEQVFSGLGSVLTTIEGQKAASPAAPSPAVGRKTNASESSDSHIGKVFFTLGGVNYVCSGNSVTSANQSTVSTAGHCLNEGPGAFASNFTFVPAYLDGAAPYGKWTAKALYTTSQWSSNGNIQYDTGFAVMNTLNGQKLSDVVGASGVQFNAARGLAYKSFGYPAASPFTGESLKSCSGTAANDPNNPQYNTQGIPCNMTGGSSGGPWFIGTSSSGYQNSVNSYGYGSNSSNMYGPYWGKVIQGTYQTASTAP